MSDRTEIPKMPTGMPGLDHLLDGGIVRGNSLLIEGPPGSGKSTFAVRILYEGIVRYNEPGLIITFEEFPRQVYAEAAAYGIDLEALEKSGMLRVVWTPPARILEGFSGKNDLVEKLVEEMKVRRLVIDSITHFKRVSDDEKGLREVLSSILNYLKLKGINAFLVKELERMDSATIAFEEYLVDASMRLHNESAHTGRHDARSLEIRKTRGQPHISGRHPFHFTPEGITVFPQLRPIDVVAGFPEKPKVAPERVALGIEGLDSMLCGGLWQGSINLVTGFPGTGKSVIANQFLETGLSAGEPCSLVSIRKTPEEYIFQAKSLGMDWEKAYRDGQLRILHFHPLQLCVDEMLNELLQGLREAQTSRFAFDSIDDLGIAVKDEDRLRDAMHLLSTMVEASGATALLLNETREMGGNSAGTGRDYAFLASCVVQLSMAETEGELRRFLGVRKHSGSDHAKELRELSIDNRGIQVMNKATGLSGILSGQTTGALTNIADEVLPSLDQITEVFGKLVGQAEISDSTLAEVKAARAKLGLMDVVLREHFGVTDFGKITEGLLPDISDLPDANSNK